MKEVKAINAVVARHGRLRPFVAKRAWNDRMLSVSILILRLNEKTSAMQGADHIIVTFAHTRKVHFHPSLHFRHRLEPIRYLELL